MPKFQLKFIDVMVGVVLGLGFQWWPELKEPWQFIAFVFAYITLIDYWVDYNPTAKKYPLRLELDVLLHTVIIFGMFLLIFATQRSLTYFLYSFAFYRVADALWLWRIKREHKIPADDLLFFNTWLRFDVVEALAAVGAAALHDRFGLGALSALFVFIAIRVATRVLSSTRYKKVFYAV